MKNLIISVAVGLLSGVTVYLLVDYLFERPNKKVTSEPEVEDFEEVESYDNTIPLKKAETATN